MRIQFAIACISLLWSQTAMAQDTTSRAKDSVGRMGTAEIEGRHHGFDLTRLRQVEGTAIYAGKKSEVIVLQDVVANVATNNTRQIYSKIAGLNIWESDGAGIQLGIGGRGLNPNRVSNFNTRQNGYDISADALGYPESYYTPPAEALERIEIVRGAASLQYGTQFGGFVNFRFKSGAENKRLELLTRQTFGSFGFYNAFTSAGGTIGKLNYYTFYQYKTGDGWRPNSNFDAHTAFAGLKYAFSKKLSVGLEYTVMNYLAQQPGGLTDRAFYEDPRQSVRGRNWFRINWNLAAMDFNYEINESSRLNWRTFGLYAQRDALGNLGRIDRPDTESERDYLMDKFRNFGSELRYLKHYKIGLLSSATFLAGSRYYKGVTYRKQGHASAGSDADFRYLNPENLENSNYTFPSQNIAVFSENIFRITDRLSVTPGLRYEYIHTASMGYFNEEYRDLAGNVIFRKKTNDNRKNIRSFLLAGFGVGYKLLNGCEAYGNISQNYRSINFNDMRIANPNSRVDPNLKDENGYSADIGIRGNKGNWLNFDASLFLLKYNDRIGSIQKSDSNTYQIYRFRTNISDSRTMGLEGFAEVNISQLLFPKIKKPHSRISAFVNYSFVHAQYFNSRETAVKDGNRVEYVPEQILRTGISASYKALRTTLQYSYTASQFTEATNSEFTTSAVDGIIPSYSVVDFTVQYSYKQWSISGSANNLLNNYYFTRRADGYPGPGIIPSDGRGYYLTLQFLIF